MGCKTILPTGEPPANCVGGVFLGKAASKLNRVSVPQRPKAYIVLRPFLFTLL